MTPTRWTWAVLIGVWVFFFSWYTSFEGPLSDEEIEHYIEIMQELGGEDATPEGLAMMRRWLEEDTGDDFVMVNLIHMRDVPHQVEGVEPGDTSDDVQAKYMEYMWPQLIRRACHPMFVGRAANRAMDLMNADGMETWTMAAGLRYRSLRDLLEILATPEFQGRHEFKIASMEKTIAFPVDPWRQLGDPRLVLGLTVGLIGFAVSSFRRWN